MLYVYICFVPSLNESLEEREDRARGRELYQFIFLKKLGHSVLGGKI